MHSVVMCHIYCPLSADSLMSAGNLGIELMDLISVKIIIELDTQCLQSSTPEVKTGG